MEVRVYYEDTDAGGVVYHANYLRFFERGRTEFLRERGFDVAAMHNAGTIFAIVSMKIDYRSPARLGDLLEIETEIGEVKNSSFIAKQRVLRRDGGTVLCEAEVTLACIGETLRAKRLPADVRDMLKKGCPGDEPSISVPSEK
ncbi:tol-pal system-associated acyl-CoA thioesterase [Geomonas sp. RF6]|uniref:tol-pal system-associated acyl-CoA thioesterase n=1 Tax=Geomonas sp. RF6 TaxID=2897342 RepID=UPI001E3A6676|nr:tol-pal system-associated acyl-CoA thioesterase [Geomonas sp. RF6]UFS71848.1 tol-pal system-associated acyl-CoA thioesterase [Geomonas sp. RF6]